MSLLTQLKLSGALTATVVTVLTIIDPAFRLGSFLGGAIFGGFVILLLKEVGP